MSKIVRLRVGSITRDVLSEDDYETRHSYCAEVVVVPRDCYLIRNGSGMVQIVKKADTQILSPQERKQIEAEAQ